MTKRQPMIGALTEPCDNCGATTATRQFRNGRAARHFLCTSCDKLVPTHYQCNGCGRFHHTLTQASDCHRSALTFLPTQLHSTRSHVHA